MRKFTWIGVIAFFATSQALAATQFFISVDGSKQGRFKQESVRKDGKDKIDGLQFSYEVVSPRDAQTGLPTGKRQHRPIVISKETGVASPQFFQALVTNEALKNVTFEFFRTNATGAEEIYYTIRLNNALIAGMRQYADAGAKVGARDTAELDEISFTFDKIEIINKDGTSAVDSWAPPN